MSALKCVVEGCNLEYDVICSFSFYNVNTGSENENQRQEWIEGAMQEEKECLWRHFSLQLCGYHFELDAQGLWIDSPMLPELLTLQEPPPLIQPSEEDKRSGRVHADSYQTRFEKFLRQAKGIMVADIIRMEHNYVGEPAKKEPKEVVSRLNVRQLVDTLGYLSLKNLQKKQLWVVKVETDKAEASITQSEQVITKMQDPKQIIEIIPQTSTVEAQPQAEVLHIMEDGQIGDNFIYEIAEEQEIAMEEVKEIPAESVTEEVEAEGGEAEWMLNISSDASKPKYAYIKQCSGDGESAESFMYEIAEEQEIAMEDVKEITTETTEASEATEWTVNITPETPKHKYAYIKHCNTGKKKRHFTADMNEITLHGDFENYYILPDVDPSVGVEITTSYEPENFIVEEYQHLVLEDRPRKRARDPSDPNKRKKKKVASPSVREQVKHIQIKNEIGEDWVIDNSVVYEDASEDYDDKKAARVRRKNKKYLGYDFVT